MDKTPKGPIHDQYVRSFASAFDPNNTRRRETDSKSNFRNAPAVPPKGVEDDGEFVDSTSYEIKSETPTALLPNLLSTRVASNLFTPLKKYRFRLASGVGAVTASSSVSATQKVAWDPTSNPEFSSLAALFGEYKVVSVRLYLFPSKVTTRESESNLLIAGSDPAGVITGTPAADTVAVLANSMRFNGSVTSKDAICFVNKGMSRCVANLAPTSDGFILTTAAWPGQTCLYSQSSTSSSAVHYLYQEEWDIDFRSRG